MGVKNTEMLMYPEYGKIGNDYVMDVARNYKEITPRLREWTKMNAKNYSIGDFAEQVSIYRKMRNWDREDAEYFQEIYKQKVFELWE